MRGKPGPRWSVAGLLNGGLLTRSVSPAAMATLGLGEVSRPSVGVGPPLFWSGPMFSPPTPVAGTPVWSPLAVKLELPTAPKPGPAVVDPMTLLPKLSNTPETSGLVVWMSVGLPLAFTNDAGVYGAT